MRRGWVYRNNAHPQPDSGGTVTFGQRQARLDRLANWELVSSPDMPEPGTDRVVMPPAWAEQPTDPDPAAPAPDPVGAQLIVVNHPRRPRKGAAPATIEGTPLDPGKGRR